MPEGADLPATIPRQVRLRTILDHPKTVLACDCHDRPHVGGLTVEVDRNDSNGSRRDGALDSGGGGRGSAVVAVAKKNTFPPPGYQLRSAYPRKWPPGHLPLAV